MNILPGCETKGQQSGLLPCEMEDRLGRGPAGRRASGPAGGAAAERFRVSDVAAGPRPRLVWTPQGERAGGRARCPLDCRFPAARRRPRDV